MSCERCANAKKGLFGVVVGCDAGVNAFIPLMTGRCGAFEDGNFQVTRRQDLVKPAQDSESDTDQPVAS